VNEQNDTKEFDRDVEPESLARAEGTEHRLRWANVGSVLFALLQSACTAVLAISGFRVLIGLSALAAASGIYAIRTQSVSR